MLAGWKEGRQKRADRKKDRQMGGQAVRHTERKAGLVLIILEIESSQQGSIRGNRRTGS